MPRFIDINTALSSSASAAACAAIGAEKVVNVVGYGATGGGVADDTAEIQAAIDAVPASGGNVYFPAGTYKISAALTVTGKSVRFYGSGNSVIRLSSLVNLFQVSSASNIAVENLTLDGNSGTLGGPGGGSLISFTDVTESVIRNCDMIDCTVAISIKRGSRISVSSNRIENTHLWGIGLTNPTDADTYNEHIWISDNHLEGCQSSGTAGNGAIQTFGDTDTVSNRYIHITNNVVLNPGDVAEAGRGVGLGLDSIDWSHVRGNVVIKDSGPIGECIAFTGCHNVISENYCRNRSTSGAAGILLWALAARANDGNQIINNRCTNGGQGIAYVWGSTGAAITNTMIQGNQCRGNNIGVQSYRGSGVTGGTQSNIVISNNNLTGNVASEANTIADGSLGITGTRSVWGNHLTATDADGVFLVTTTATQTVTNKTLTSATLTSPIIGTSIKDTSGNTLIGLTPYGSAVNYMTLTNRAAGQPPSILLAGSDPNIDLQVNPKGTGKVSIYAGAGATPTIKAFGADTNVNLNLTTQAAGVVQANGNPLGVKVAVPATAGATGVVGQWAADASWFYVCTAANTWVRAALASW